MASTAHLRRILPISQTVFAASLGGWGLWIRNSILDQPFFDNPTSWQTSARFHVWPWPFKFAVVSNMPAFLAGELLSWPVSALWPGLSEPISYLPALLLVPLLWYRIGSRLDRSRGTNQGPKMLSKQWIALLAFFVICAAGASIPPRIGGYVSFVPLGIVIWAAAVAGISFSVSNN